MKQKVLSLCFPTYNRGWCMKEQIERLKSCPKETLDRMEIIISDNCSTDDTQEIVEKAISTGFLCRYIRNETNLGMDGNFVSCFRKAQGRYVWLLGDDDTIIIESLVRIVELLDVPEEYGLLHIYQRWNLEQEIIYVDNKDEMTKYVSYYITFISANIVNTKYVPQINFEKYMGTWFTLMPLYLSAYINEPHNVIYNVKTFEEAKDYSRNGGYNFFAVFVQNYLSIMDEYIPNRELIRWLKKDIWPLIYGNAIKMLIKRNIGNYKTDKSWRILFKYYGSELYFWRDLAKYPFDVIKRKTKRYFSN